MFSNSFRWRKNSGYEQLCSPWQLANKFLGILDFASLRSLRLIMAEIHFAASLEHSHGLDYEIGWEENKTFSTVFQLSYNVQERPTRRGKNAQTRRVKEMK